MPICFSFGSHFWVASFQQVAACRSHWRLLSQTLSLGQGAVGRVLVRPAEAAAARGQGEQKARGHVGESAAKGCT